MASSSNPPVAIICVGMAGSGKTTFMQRIIAHQHQQQKPPYVLNLDPAVHSVPFDPNIDIRDSVNYKEVMKQYNLGPNGGIMTSLNLFATKVDQVIGLLERRTGITERVDGGSVEKSAPISSTSKITQESASKQKATTTEQTQPPISHILVDTPGQIEVFVWSASGTILLDSIASSFPTVIAYVIDTPRSMSSSTFMSNMLYACSILYKTKLPMILVFNKTDVQDAEFAKEWMTDFEAFQAAVQREDHSSLGKANESYGGGSGYMGSLLHSMSLVLEEFYRHLRVVGVSAFLGSGIDAFFDAVDEKREEFEKDYRPELEKRRKLKAEEYKRRKDAELGRLMEDMNVAEDVNSKWGKRPLKEEPETISDLEDEDEHRDQSEDLT